ncbi:hypothetical protein LC607_06210 [Nostoc sp. CHAB 5824]|nr:hypothetical protein [Nostoc sp. CHAB 5824]
MANEFDNLANGRAAFECLGNIPGPKFLDGRTADGTVGLAPDTGENFSGTRWRLKIF